MRAKTIEQKQEIINRLLELWNKNPQLRLSQLILNVFRDDFYYKEDFVFIEQLEKAYGVE
jgi:uncharacterized protein YihD (DUF1040 family)